MLKLAGGAAVMISCAMASSYAVSVEKRKIEQLETFISLIKHVRNQIDCYSMPVEKILAMGSEFLKRLGVEDGTSDFSRLLSECKIECGEDCKKILYTFSENLGKGYREHQVKMCDGTLSELEDIRKRLLAAYPSKKKIAFALCFAAGGALLISLL